MSKVTRQKLNDNDELLPSFHPRFLSFVFLWSKRCIRTISSSSRSSYFSTLSIFFSHSQLTLEDGTPVKTQSEWIERKNEIKSLFIKVKKKLFPTDTHPTK